MRVAATQVTGERLGLPDQMIKPGQFPANHGVSVTTVRRHITAIRTKLSVASRFAAGRSSRLALRLDRIKPTAARHTGLDRFAAGGGR
jgi:hypothetical protein